MTKLNKYGFYSMMIGLILSFISLLINNILLYILSIILILIGYKLYNKKNGKFIRKI